MKVAKQFWLFFLWIMLNVGMMKAPCKPACFWQGYKCPTIEDKDTHEKRDMSCYGGQEVEHHTDLSTGTGLQGSSTTTLQGVWADWEGSLGYGCCYDPNEQLKKCLSTGDCVQSTSGEPSGISTGLACIENYCRKYYQPCLSDDECAKVGTCGGTCNKDKGICEAKKCSSDASQ